jgi:hypothetical protein
MPTDESHLAEIALSVFAGRDCEYTREPLDPVTGHCGDSSHTHCPFCGVPSGWECGHVLATWDSEQGYDGPPLPVPPAGAEKLTELTDGEKALLGEFSQLCPVYEEYLTGESYPTGSFYYRLNENWLYCELVDWVVRRVPEIRVRSWEPSGPGGANGDVWYAARPDEARAKVHALTERVTQAFASVPPAPVSTFGRRADTD